MKRDSFSHLYYLLPVIRYEPNILYYMYTHIVFVMFCMYVPKYYKKLLMCLFVDTFGHCCDSPLLVNFFYGVVCAVYWIVLCFYYWQESATSWWHFRRKTTGKVCSSSSQSRRSTQDEFVHNGKYEKSNHRWIQRPCRSIRRSLLRRSKRK